MTSDQAIALLVLIGVVGVMIWGKIRSDVAALSGAAVLLVTGVIRPVEVQGAFASPAILALASLFVIAYAIELSGLLGLMIRKAISLCGRLGAAGIWLVIVFCGLLGFFLNNTPIVVLAAPVVRDVAKSLSLSPKRFLIPLSYVTVLGGCCTLIGTSTNLLVNDMARNAGQAPFGLFEFTAPASLVALAGGVYLFFFSDILLAKAGQRDPEPVPADVDADASDASLGEPELFAVERPLNLRKAGLSLVVFVTVVVAAGTGVAPIAAAAFAGAVALVLARVIDVDDAYKGLRPDVLLLIAGMVVVGLSLETSGLAAVATGSLVDWMKPLGPLAALAIFYGVTLVVTEFLSNAAVAVLLTPVAVALAESLGVNPRPFLVAVMLAASAAFATPFGYQTNVLVFQMGRYRYMDFVRIGLPLNIVTWIVAVLAIPRWFPF